jgi:TolB protein
MEEAAEITATPGPTITPRPTPTAIDPNAAPEHIVFYASGDEDEYSIYTIDTDSDERAIIDTKRYFSSVWPYADLEPAWSPDGGFLAFVSTRTGGYDIHVSAADGSDAIRLTRNVSENRRPAWSPDGRYLTFHTASGTEPFNIWKVAVEGTRLMYADLVQLTDDPAGAFAPAWSPDGQQIAFHSYRDGNGNIYLMDTDGANHRRITDHPANDTDPAFSPDGEYIAFQSSRDTPDGCGMNVWGMWADGSDPRNLTGHTDCAPRSGAPTWSPDGTMLAFQRQASRDGEMQIVVLELTRTGDTMQPGAVRILGPGSFPDWGP